MISPNVLVSAMNACDLGGRVAGDEIWYPYGGMEMWWDLKSEDPWLESLLRSEVRKHAPGSFVKPVFHPQPHFQLLIHTEYGIPPEQALNVWMRHALHFGSSEIECWALALIALFEAGILGLPEVKQP